MCFTKLLAVVAMLALLGACASTPTIFNQPMPGAPSLSEVNADIDKHKGSRVRWGGVIASVKNRQNETWIELVQYQLDRRGRPIDSDSEGRFYLKFAGFLEPKDYAVGREITAVGEVSETVTQKIGEHNYVYPVVSVNSAEFVLWNEYSNYYDPYPYSPSYDPFYDPFYAPFYYPYFRFGFPYHYPYGYRHRYFGRPHYIY